MDSAINKLFEYFDKVFFEERVDGNEDGYYGSTYQSLFLDTYLENSVFGVDYLSIEDYFETEANVKYSERESLFSQYAKENIDTRLKVIGAILTLVNASTYNEKYKHVILNRSKAFLKRYGLDLEEDAGMLRINNDCKVAEGSYCDIYVLNEQIYKKQLKTIYRAQEEWKKRFKYEYENMMKLVQSPYILKVFNYDATEDSYLMEKCDYNIYDYLSNNPFVTDVMLLQIITELLIGMKHVHDAGIIHRDLHLGNILIKDGHVVLSDFGLSKDAMIKHSLKSTSTPKNTHLFIDPIGLSSFTLLDKLSDIYSVGKIIDYITAQSELNKKFSYVISKATNRNRAKRYSSMDELIEDVDNSIKEISEEDKMKRIETKMKRGEISSEVEEFVTNLLRQNQLSHFLVRKQLYNFGKLLLEFNETDQHTILSEMNDNYSEATGYGQFQNYDLFATIANHVIRHSSNIKIQNKAYELLEGCAKYRYSAANYLREINTYNPTLGREL